MNDEAKLSETLARVEREQAEKKARADEQHMLMVRELEDRHEEHEALMRWREREQANVFDHRHAVEEAMREQNAVLARIAAALEGKAR